MKERKDYLLEQARNDHIELMNILDQVDGLADDAYLSGEVAQLVLRKGLNRARDYLVLELACITESVAKCSREKRGREDLTT